MTARRRRTGAMVAGVVALAVDFSPPLDGLAARRFSAHMVQHLLLVLVAAPLVVLGRPAALRRMVGVAHPLVLLAAYIGVFWAWHLPGLYQAALGNDAVHLLEHASFLGTALGFWALVLDTAVRRRLSAGAAFGFVFAALLANVWLAAAISFAPAPLYPAYGDLADQQLAGVLMWVPGDAVYALTLAVLFLRFLADAEARVRRREARAAGEGG